MTFREYLIDKNACGESLSWLKNRTSTEAWNECENPQWLLWWSQQNLQEIKIYVSISCKFARLVLHLTNLPETLLAIEAAEKWLTDPSEINHCAARAASAASSAASSAATAASDTASYAASAATAATAARAARTASAASNSATAARTARAARIDINKSLCDIIRKEIPQPWIES